MNKASQWYKLHGALYWQRNQVRLDREGLRRSTALRELLPKEFSNVPWLEIGCGQGHNLYEHDCGVDLTDMFLEKFQRRNIRLLLGDAEALPFLPSCSFPVVFCVGLLMHLQEYTKALNEMGRISSGYVLIGEYIGKKEVDLMWNPEVGIIGDGPPGYLWKRPYDPPTGYSLQSTFTKVAPFSTEVTFLLFKRN